MLRYILKRIFYVMFVFLVVSVLMFLIYKAVPGDPARMMVDSSKQGVDPVVYEQMYQSARESLGLDKPLIIQYFSWFFKMITGDFGFSSQYRMPVKDMVAAPMMNTIVLNLAALILVFAISIPLGIITAVKKGKPFDTAVQIGSIVGYSLPAFVVSLVLIYLLAIKIPIFPISGVTSAAFEGNSFQKVLDILAHMGLPVIVITLASLGSITRYVRAAMIEVLKMDYIRTARAKGLKEKVVIYSHAFRNALIPIVTIVTSWLVSIFGGSVVIESIFLWNGIGKVLFDALLQRDFAVVLAMQMFYVVLTLAGNFIMDIGYSLVDPRIKLRN
ncbi:MAG: ABC transporter permease [Oscillospiraceae bacterium]